MNYRPSRPNPKTTLQICLFLAVIFVGPETDAFARTPYVIKIVEKPAVLRIGQAHTFIFDVQNVSGAALTLSSKCAARASLSWLNRDGTGGGTGSGCGGSLLVTSTNYDPTTGKFSCNTKILPYSEEDFFTLQPNETKRFEAEAHVPTDLRPRFVTVTVSYESRHDGSSIGLQAWTGAASSISLKMRVVK